MPRRKQNHPTRMKSGSEEGKDEGENTSTPSADDAREPSEMSTSSPSPASPASSDVSNKDTDVSERQSPPPAEQPTPDAAEQEQAHSDERHSKDVVVTPTVDTDAEGISAERAPAATEATEPSVTDPVSPKAVSPAPPAEIRQKETQCADLSERLSTDAAAVADTQRDAASPASRDVSPSPTGKMQTLDEQPLDLSLKSKPRECDEDAFNAFEKAFVPKVAPLVIKPLSPPPPPVVSVAASEGSSLANLEKRFGGDSVLLRQEQTRSQVTFRPTAFTTFGGNIYSSALYNIQPKMFPGQQLKPAPPNHCRLPSSHHCKTPEVTSVKPYEHHHHALSKSAHDTTKGSCVTPSNEGLYVKPDVGRMHTQLSCGCGLVFDTLVGLTVHLQETGHPAATGSAVHAEYPKLVRGQDMWLNHGSEQTAQILRCMQCGKSFKSLPELTVHMIDTKHYTNIVGPEPHRNLTKYLSYGGETEHRKLFQLYGGSGGACGGVGGERTLCKCRVCGRAFDDMDGLAYHMVATNHHHKRRGDFSDTDSDSASVASSLVADDELRSSARSVGSGKKQRLSVKHERRSPDQCDRLSADDANTIRCINCGEEKDTASFVDHVRLCVKQINVNRATSEVTSRCKPPSDRDRNADSGARRLGGLVTPPATDGRLRLAAGLVTPPDSSGRLDDRLASPPAGGGTRDSCALSQMESFIAKSFTNSHQNNNRYGAKNSHHHHAATTPGKLPSASPNGVALPATTGAASYKHKYVQPFDSSPPPLPPVQPLPQPLPQPARLTPKNDLHTEVKVKVETRDRDYEKQLNGVVKENGSYSDSRCEANGVASGKQQQQQQQQQQQKQQQQQQQAKQLHEKYLRDEASSSAAAPVTSEESKSSVSALSSLQGLVYGQPLSSEHPIDSLEKLLHDTAATAASLMSPSTHAHTHTYTHADVRMHGSIATSTALLQKGIPGGTVILVNPIVTVLPGGSSSTPPSVHISLPVPGDVVSSDAHAQHSPSKLTTTTPDMTSSEPIEPCRCPACKRTFASKGSYRYHLSRCHLGTKRFGGGGAVKEVFSKSPYVYLPLDHATKFNRYYKMASELANNGK